MKATWLICLVFSLAVLIVQSLLSDVEVLSDSSIKDVIGGDAFEGCHCVHLDLFMDCAVEVQGKPCVVNTDCTGCKDTAQNSYCNEKSSNPHLPVCEELSDWQCTWKTWLESDPEGPCRDTKDGFKCSAQITHESKLTSCDGRHIGQCQYR